MNSLVKLQLAHDRALLTGQPWLLKRKWARMSASPFAFLRGSSALWAHVMKSHPGYLKGVPGRGVLVGDLHLENVGTFVTSRGLTVNVNDFDETFEGPWAFDVLRLLTSVLLARSEFQVTGTQVLSFAEAMLDGHAAGLRGGSVAPPNTVQHALAQARASTIAKLLKKRTASERRLLRVPEKTVDAPASVARQVPAALERFATQLPQPQKVDAQAFEVLDVVRRIMGTGSLGVERLLVLTRGEKTRWLFDVKEVRGSVFSPQRASAEHLIRNQQRALPLPPLGFGASRLGTLPVTVHRLHPGTEKLSIDDYERDELPAVCRYIGMLCGQLHARGADSRATWGPRIHRELLKRAAQLAGAHEHAFVEFCAALRQGQPS